ncbi:solute carrier family 23 protein [Gordonia polyisoprenivorans]|uniref:solute carrier family 23 protein n=1 Tax=Gordonia polyisoprenivorans TaxID=84595 RepID=UPI0020111CCA|nr:bifunctional SulP family inorganic anion transporter/carbonic anhydrase [Gordonia polyisoprenivorans]
MPKIGDRSHTHSRLDIREVIRYDLPASLVVFLVALPLSIGIAIASGAPVMAGLIAAVVGGVVAGAIGGSPLQVSGPAAGLTVVVAELVANFGWKVTCAITVCAGVLQILFGLSRIAGAALAIAPVVVHAMLAGIGITIALQQIHVLLGGNSSSSAVANITGLPDQLIDVNVAEASIGLLVIAALLAWPRLPATVRKIPGPLGAIVLATLVALIAGLDVKRITLDGNFFESIALPELPTGNWSAFILGVLTVALIASVESLLSAVAVDKMHDGPRSNFNRELLGQGSANMVSGVLGGLPVTGVIVRSSTNVATGARTRWSAILHGVWVFVFAVFLTALVEQIPTAALAGLLVVIGMQLVKLAHMKTALRTGDLWVYGATVTAVVFLNLLEGVAIGLALAVILVLWRVIRPDTHTEEQPDGRHIVRVRGSLSFLSLPRMNSLLRRIPEGAPVTIELDTDFLDHAASEMLEDWIRARRAAGGEVIILERGRARIEHAWQAPPRRHTGGIVGLTPWRSRSSVADDEQVAEVPAPLRSIMAGVTEYHRDHAEVLRGHLSDVVDYQEPDAFFLTCADSRIMPNIITSSGPGDLFTLRNVGNLVPTGDHADCSIEAALDFAITEVGVSSVVVCGHSSCGAMRALHQQADSAPADTSIARWLRHGVPSVSAMRLGHPAGRAAAAMGFTEIDQLAVVNVAKQVETLSRHHLAGRAAAESSLRIIGLYFDIRSGRVYEVSQTGLHAAGVGHHVSRMLEREPVVDH